MLLISHSSFNSLAVATASKHESLRGLACMVSRSAVHHSDSEIFGGSDRHVHRPTVGSGSLKPDKPTTICLSKGFSSESL